MNDDPLGSNSNGHERDAEVGQGEYAGDHTLHTPVCAACGQTVDGTYYEINGQAHCDPCCGEIEADRLGGSRPARVLRATILGIIAGAVGAAIYYTVAALTGYEIGLIALLVGLLVGGAVRWGSKARGGWFYQCLAMFLTYAAIGVSYGLFMAQAIAEDPSLLDPNAPAVTSAPSGSTAESGALPLAESQPAEDPNELFGDLSTGEKVAGVGIGLAFIAFVVLALPILVGIEAPFALLILGIALYEAWKINKRQPLDVTGPYAVGTDVPDYMETASQEDIHG